MRKYYFLVLLALLQLFISRAQSSSAIDSKNYYSFQDKKPGITTAWLGYADAVPVIIDELLNNNIPQHLISVGDLMKINDSTRFVVTVSFEKNGKKYGFLFNADHGIPLRPMDRDYITNPSLSAYIQVEYDLK